LDRRDAHVRNHRRASDPPGQRRIERPAQDLLRDDHVELGCVVPEPSERTPLEFEAAARNFVEVDACAAGQHAFFETAFGELPRRHAQRQIANLAETGDEPDVGEAFDEEEYWTHSGPWLVLVLSPCLVP